MIGLWFVIATDLMALTGLVWVGGYVSRALFVAVTVATNAVLAGWIGWRRYAIRRAQQSAAGERSEQAFEHRLQTLIDTDDPLALPTWSLSTTTPPQPTTPQQLTTPPQPTRPPLSKRRLPPTRPQPTRPTPSQPGSSYSVSRVTVSACSSSRIAWLSAASTTTSMISLPSRSAAVA